jgi:biopolymer transport protein TolR
MKSSRKGLRKIRRAKKQAQVTSINLVSMIDIFTILIIYLLVNAAAVQIAGAEMVEMPKSIASEPPRPNVSVIVTKDVILVDDKPVMKIADIKPDSPTILEPLKNYLLTVSPPTPTMQANAEKEGGEVNILADKTVKYALLKKVMTTCAEAKFAKIQLGVSPKSTKGS